MNKFTKQTLNNLVEILSGFAFDSNKFSKSGEIPIIRIRDIIPRKSSTFYSGKYDEKFVIQDGDLLIGMDGEFNRARWQGGKALLNQRVCRISASSDKLDNAYLFHFLPLALKVIEDATPFVTVKHLSVKTIREIEIPLPPLEEQKRIAEILDRTQSLISKRKEAIELLGTLTQSIFIEMFGNPLTNPKGWDITKVEKIADVQGGLQVSSSRKKYPREISYLRVANVYRGYLNLSEIKLICATDTEISRTLLKKNDLLIVEGHGNPNEIGRVALWDGSITECVHQNHIIRARFDTSKIVPLYVCQYLNSSGGRQHLLKSGKTTSGLNTINVSEVRSAPIWLPPLPLQKEFAQRIEAIEKLKATHRASLTELQALFASLQHRAFRGEL